MRLTGFIDRFLPASKHDIEELKRLIMATQAELTATLKEVEAQQKKTLSEIQNLQSEMDKLQEDIKALEDQIAKGEVGQELTDAVAAVKAQAQVVDDAIPDLPSPTPTP